MRFSYVSSLLLCLNTNHYMLPGIAQGTSNSLKDSLKKILIQIKV